MRAGCQLLGKDVLRKLLYAAEINAALESFSAVEAEKALAGFTVQLKYLEGRDLLVRGVAFGLQLLHRPVTYQDRGDS